jgi:exopolysaccharide production protein ExoQ
LSPAVTSGWDLERRDGRYRHEILSFLFHSRGRSNVRALKITKEEMLVFVVFFCFATQMFPILFLGDGGPTQDIKESLRYAWIPAYLAILALVLPRLPVVLAGARRAPLIVLLNLLCISSVFWSVAPEDTARRSVALLLSTIFGLYIGVRFAQIRYLRLVALVFGVVVLASFAFALLPGQIGVMNAPEEMAGSWRGIYPHKNLLGRAMVLALMVLAVVAPRFPSWRMYIRLEFLLALALLLLSGSMTSLIIGIVAAAAYGIVSLLRRRSHHKPALMIAGLLALPLMVVAAFNMDAIFGLFGRDSTLTGRTDVWDLIWEEIQNRYWLGYGYQAFWVDPAGPATRVWLELKWDAPEVHNGYLELWLGLGLIGLLAFATSMVTNSVLAWKASRGADRLVSYWPVLYLTFFISYNLSESLILEQNDIFWTLFVAVVVSLQPSPKRYPHPAMQPARGHRYPALARTWSQS